MIKRSLIYNNHNTIKLKKRHTLLSSAMVIESFKLKWIYDNCPSGTYVEIYDSEEPGPLGKPEAMKLDADSPNKGWDPTDPDERNPWHAWSEDE